MTIYPSHLFRHYNDYRHMTMVSKMQQEMSKSAFKAHALEVMRSVEETGENVVITAHGKKALVLTSYKDKSVSPMEKLKGSVVQFDQPHDPIGEDDWELS